MALEPGPSGWLEHDWASIMANTSTTARAGLVAAWLSLLVAGCTDTGVNGFLATDPLASTADQTASATPAAESLADAGKLEQRGDRQKALSAASLALAAEPANPDVVVVYSRLAVAAGKIEDAEKALTAAEAAGVADWRILSAKGAVLAEKGDLAGAKLALQKGLNLAPGQPALLNNLAFVHALEGEPKKAEELLRQASAAPGANPRTRQNLALVLGLQGKFDESKQIAAAETTPEVADANIAFLKGLTAAKSETKLAKAGG
jgi:Flp pilus assembly protein TadD